MELKLVLFTCFFYSFTFLIPATQQTVLVKRRGLNETLKTFDAAEATFGPVLNDAEIWGYLVEVEPAYACSSLPPAPTVPDDLNTEDVNRMSSVATGHSGVSFLQYLLHSFNVLRHSPTVHSFPRATANFTLGMIALIRRGNCSFVQKVRTAQTANYSSVIVYDDTPGGTAIRMGHDRSEGSGINIPSVFITLEDAMELRDFRYEPSDHQYLVVITGTPNLPWTYYVFTLFAVVLVALSGLIVVFLIKTIIDWRIAARNRLSRRHLKKLPERKYRKESDAHETCAICLEDYTVGDYLRVLPCGHAFHSRRCIDPWLLNNHRTCPICKRYVRIPGLPSHLMTAEDMEEGNAGAAVSSSTSTFMVASSHFLATTSSLPASAVAEPASSTSQDDTRRDVEQTTVKAAKETEPLLTSEGGPTNATVIGSAVYGTVDQQQQQPTQEPSSSTRTSSRMIHEVTNAGFLDEEGGCSPHALNEVTTEVTTDTDMELSSSRTQLVQESPELDPLIHPQTHSHAHHPQV